MFLPILKKVKEKYPHLVVFNSQELFKKARTIKHEQEIEEITDAIYHHSDKSRVGQTGLAGLLAKADQMSRACFVCAAEKECNWKDERKNYIIEW